MNEFVYYEIWNTVSEMEAECTERCITFEIAVEHLNNHCDWYSRKGTGKIYEVKMMPEKDGSITKISKEVYKE